MGIETRVAITPLARRIHTEGWKPDRSMPAIGEFHPPGSLEAQIAYTKLKPEIYAIAAVFCNAAVDDAIVKTRKKPIDPRGTYLTTFHTSIHQPLLEFVDFILDGALNGTRGKESEASIVRLRTLLQYVSLILPDEHNFPNVNSFLIQGVNTATKTMVGILKMLPGLANTDNPKSLVEIARNSYPLIVNFASPHAVLAITSIDSLEAPLSNGRTNTFVNFNPTFFTINGSNGRVKICLSEAGEEQVSSVQDQISSWIYGSNFPISPTIGCPALMKFGSASPVKKLWDWHIEVAEKIYEYQDRHV